MKAQVFDNVKVAGIACAVPNNKKYSDDYIDYYGKEGVERFKKATGIVSRYMSNGKQTASDLCYVAADELMKSKGLTGEDIDALIFVTQTADYCIPSTAFVLQKRLNIKTDCIVFDMNIGCSGFVNGIYILAGMIQSGMLQRALLLVGDAAVERPVTEDKSFSMMFGDAGSACILERGEGLIRGMIRSDGNGYDTLITPFPGARFPITEENLIRFEHPQKMDGDDTFLFTITKVPKLFKEFYKHFECSFEDFDYCMLHQANLMIINQITKKLKMPVEKVPVSIENYGNTDGASIPVGIVDLCESINEDKKLKLITSGFGIGLSWGVVSFDIDTKDVLPMIFTDDYYEEGYNV
ncbi:MAG: ketoacyl-ACP synthase III [Eubacteriales bacterium]|nr:ketoacyl-ACP synthase III [Eubacteriales bacterium]